MFTALRQSTPKLVVIVFFICSMATDLRADLISTSTATGSQGWDDKKRFVGILDVTPTQLEVLSEQVEFKDIPFRQSFMDGDLVGSELDRAVLAGGGRTWEYMIMLPSDAAGATGLENIQFNGFAFERDRDNLEGTDELSWQLFLNDELVSVDSSSTGAGVDFDTHTVSLFNRGGSSITSARVVLTINGFDEGEEWFATRGTLSANYTAVPEAFGLLWLLGGWIGLSGRRRRRIAGLP